jgi:hypothetical protein
MAVLAGLRQARRQPRAPADNSSAHIDLIAGLVPWYLHSSMFRLIPRNLGIKLTMTFGSQRRWMPFLGHRANSRENVPQMFLRFSPE